MLITSDDSFISSFRVVAHLKQAGHQVFHLVHTVYHDQGVHLNGIRVLCKYNSLIIQTMSRNIFPYDWDILIIGLQRNAKYMSKIPLLDKFEFLQVVKI